MSVVQKLLAPPASIQAEPCAPWRYDIEAIAVTMALALRGCLAGWETITAREVKLEGFSGFGGGKTYRLSHHGNPGAQTAALHVLPESCCPPFGEPVFFDRQRRAHGLFAAAGICPLRLYDDPGKQWFVEEWAGERIDDDASLAEVREIARLIARVHQIDTRWYDVIRQRQRKLYPALAVAPVGSHIWWYAAKPWFFAQVNEQMLRAWIRTGPLPASAAGARLVTLHGDVHYRNVVRTRAGLQLIDAEMACVGSAIHDIAYCWSDTFNGCVCATSERKDAFLKAYLVESGLPAEPADVFALRLDAERCRMGTNFTDPNALWGFVRARGESEDIGEIYPQLEAIADRALVDRGLAQEILTSGFGQCAAVQAVHRNAGTAQLGMPVSAHAGLEFSPQRCAFEINWDGTIQRAFERWHGLVLGVDAAGRIVLTNISNTDERVQLRMRPDGVPVTGRRAPSSAIVHLHLAGEHAGKALVVHRIDGGDSENTLEFVRVGQRADALAVHIEADGVLRLAERPHQAFDCANGETAAGTPVNVYHNHCEDNQRFVANDDATLSPVENRNVVWGVHGDDLTLVGKDDAWAQRLTFCEEVLAAARAPGATTLVKNEPPLREAGHVLELASHPGMALAAVTAGAGGDPWKLMLVPLEQAQRIVVAADHLRFVAGDWILALGEPPSGSRD